MYDFVLRQALTKFGKLILQYTIHMYSGYLTRLISLLADSFAV